MKHPKLRIRKKLKITKIRKFKQALNNIVEDCLVDIRWYIIDDILRYLKKEGIIYAETSKTNKKKNKRKAKK